MAVLKRHVIPGMPKDTYDEVTSAVEESQLATPGFVSHYAFFDGDVLTVIEIWDSRADHDKWFDANVRPMLPESAPLPEVFEVHKARTAG
jgi:heme-degrading monooxygenase HmoA